MVALLFWQYLKSLSTGNKDTTVSFQVPYWKCDDGSDLELVRSFYL